MSGLDQIVAKITQDANNTAKEAQTYAEQKAKSAREDVLKQAREEQDELLEHAKRRAQTTIATATVGAQQQGHQILLSARQSVIDDIIGMLYSRLAALGDSEYFGLLKRLFSEYALPREGVMELSKSDYERMPAGFEQALNSSLKGNGSIKIQESKKRDIGGGFILNYGGVQENCTFKALIAAKQDELRDKICERLFSE